MLPDISEIKSRRKKLGITQKKLAADLGLSQSFIAKIESRSESPGYETVRKIFLHLERAESREKPKVRDFMSRKLVSVSPKDTVRRAARLMNEFGFSQLPVVSSNISYGSVSETTINARIMEEGKRNALSLKVEQVMDAPFPEVDEATPVNAVYPLIINSKAVLVKRREKIIGIMTNSDLFRQIL